MAMRGIIFDIQRNSYVDGPGLRTTVFMKGCNLNCKWCHNPEGLNAESQYVHYEKLCTGCRLCQRICLQQALNEIGRPDNKKCILCGKCALYCPNAAIRLYGRTITPEELMDVFVRDKAYFESSGGGVTFSGGECLLQAAFVAQTAKMCANENISVAIDTAGNVPFESVEMLLPYAQWFLYDIKAEDSDIHKRLTGVGNKRILENLRRLLDIAPEKVILRIPVIPGCNDTPQNSQIPKIAALLSRMPKPYELELLPYHRLGESKRAALGEEFFSTDVPDKTHMEALKQLF